MLCFLWYTERNINFFQHTDNNDIWLRFDIIMTNVFNIPKMLTFQISGTDIFDLMLMLLDVLC